MRYRKKRGRPFGIKLKDYVPAKTKKRCTQCKKIKLLTEFYPHKITYDGLQSYCKKCHQRICKPIRLRRRKQYRELVDNLKAKPCMDCGGKFPSECMDFDHVRGKKRLPIAKAILTKHWSLERLLEEIAKCDLVCANCHRVRTRDRRLKK